MNTAKILELLGTTSEQKMETLRRQESYPISAEESANDILNADLFGEVAPRKSAKEEVSTSEGLSKVSLPKEIKEKLRAKEDIDEEEINKQFADEVSVDDTSVDMAVDVPVSTDSWMSMDGKDEAGNTVAMFDYDSNLVSADVVNAVTSLLAENSIILSAIAKDAEPVEEAVATEKCGSHRSIKREDKAEEMVVETASEKFPDDFDFDVDKFSDEYGIDKDSLTCIYVPEDTEAKIAEHIEVSFTFEGSTVTLSISADGTVSETVDAEVIEPAQFSAKFDVEEGEDGTKTDVLVLTLVDEGEDVGDTVKSEEDSLTQSEGDNDHVDEDGKGSTDEFVEEAGLNIDGFYSEQHDMPKADNSVHEVKATESLAAKLVRTSKK